jgi:hypothetical protein
MSENFELLETGQIEIMHENVHSRLGEDADCDALRMQHDSLAAELVKRGEIHDTEIICPESELGQKAPNYRRGFTDDICTNCAFGQLFPFCNLYKADYVKGFTCDSFRYFEMLELEPPHGFLVAQQKETAIATCHLMDHEKAYLIVSNGEAFGIAVLDEPAQMKIKEFDREKWLNQHRITPRERRQWWPDTEKFYVYRLKEWHPYEGVKLYDDGRVIDEPKLTSKQWQIVSKAKELPKQIILENDFISLTTNHIVVCGDKSFYNREVKPIIDATFDEQIDVNCAGPDDEIISLYSLALVRNPRMRVSKKNVKQEGETMPFGITRNDEGEYCVINTDTDEVQACHETEEEAEAQLAALRINVEAEEGEAAVYSDKPRKRKPRKKEFEGPDQVVQTIEKNEPEKAKKTGLMESLRSVAKSIGDFLKLAETEEKEDKLFVNEVGIGQKIVNGELWHFTYSTNAFEDRENETFSTKGLEDYVSANESNADKGFFNLWHINEEDGNFNTDFAKKQWQGVVGRFLVEAGPYLRDKKGNAARKFFKKFGDGHPDIAPEGWGCSPEFRYLPEERASSVYDTVWITRTSTLPKFAAANIWTETRQFKHGGTKMALSDQQKKAAIEIFGDDFVNRMTEEAEGKTAELEAAGVAHKSETEKVENEQQPEPQKINMEELAAEVGKQFTANLTPIAEAMATMVSSVKGLEERLEKLERTEKVKDKTEMPKMIFEWKRASEAGETTVTDDDDLKNEKPKEAAMKSNDPWLQMFK